MEKETKEDIFVGNYDDNPNLELAYIPYLLIHFFNSSIFQISR